MEPFPMITGHPQVAHADVLDVGANDHHAQSHTLASHSTRPHSALTGVGANDHHTKPGIVRKTADETVNNSTTYQNDDHLLYAVGANQVYFFILWLRYTTGSVPNIKVQFVGPAGATISAYHQGWDTTHAYDEQLGSTGHVLESNIVEHAAIFHGVIRTGGASGNFQVQWAQNTAEVSDTVVNLDSMLAVWILE